MLKSLKSIKLSNGILNGFETDNGKYIFSNNQRENV